MCSALFSLVQGYDELIKSWFTSSQSEGDKIFLCYFYVPN